MKSELAYKVSELIEELEHYKSKYYDLCNLDEDKITLSLTDYEANVIICKKSICKVICEKLIEELESQIKSIESQISKL